MKVRFYSITASRQKKQDNNEKLDVIISRDKG